MIFYKLTEDEKDLLIGKEFMKDSYFNPILIQDNWIISIEEVQQCNNEFIWVKDLPTIDLEIIDEIV
jgi:hypothetical protein